MPNTVTSDVNGMGKPIGLRASSRVRYVMINNLLARA
jgi:hypothetical protein